MTDGVGWAGSLFGLVGFVFAMIGGGFCAAVLHGAALKRRVLAHGLPAEARCLETCVSRDAEGSTRRKVILGFTTEDGRQIRFKVGAPSLMVAGDRVRVRYLPTRPERAVVVGSGGPAALIGTAAAVVFCLVFMVGGLFFGLAGLGVGVLGLCTPR